MKTVEKVEKSRNIDGVSRIVLDTFHDDRGEIWTIHSEEYCDYKFVADKMSVSRFGVLRGFHGDAHTAKLIACLNGYMQLALLDLRRNSSTYGKVESYLLSDDKPSVVIVPEGIVNAHLALSDRTIFYYKWSETYKGPENQVTIAWNDPEIKADWKINPIFLSERDKYGVPFKDIYL